MYDHFFCFSFFFFSFVSRAVSLFYALPFWKRWRVVRLSDLLLLRFANISIISCLPPFFILVFIYVYIYLHIYIESGGEEVEMEEEPKLIQKMHSSFLSSKEGQKEDQIRSKENGEL